MQVNVLVLEGPPESLDENVVLATTTAVHADGNLVVFKNLGERVTGKLSPLVCIEDFWCTIAAQGLFKGFDTKSRFQGIGYPPG